MHGSMAQIHGVSRCLKLKMSHYPHLTFVPIKGTVRVLGLFRKETKMSRRLLGFKDRLQGFFGEDSGQGTIEYILLIALIGLLAVSASGTFSIAINSSVSSVTNNLKHHVNHGKDPDKGKGGGNGQN